MTTSALQESAAEGAADLELTPKLPATVGPYRILRKLGQGGMAQTFEVVLERGRFARKLCLKWALPLDEDQRQLFQEEAGILARLEHPCIVQALDAGEHQGRPYLVMELVRGLDLHQLLDALEKADRSLSIEVAAYVAAEVAEALHYVHTLTGPDGAPLSIVHRDVSPHNILVGRDGVVKLADFGIAAYAGRPKLTATNAIRGKAQYFSPEQLEPSRGLDARSDLFALGAVLYQCLAGGIRPFPHATLSRNFPLILTGNFEPLAVCAPVVGAELGAFVDSMLAPDKEKRPRSGLEVAERLRELAPPRSPRAALAHLVRAATGAGPYPDRTPISTGPASRPGPDTPDTRPTRAPTPASTLASPETPSVHPATQPPRRRRAIVVVTTTLLSAGALLFALRRPTPATPSPTPGVVGRAPQAPALGAAAEDVIATPEPEPTRAAEPSKAFDSPPPASTPPIPTPSVLPDAPRAAEPPTDARRGALRVAVVPWGHVWVDGAYAGRSPGDVFMRLRPGVHTVAVSLSPSQPGAPHTVTIEPGEPTVVNLVATE